MKNIDLEKEQQLLARAQQDKSAFSELYQYYLNDVYRFSYSICSNQHDAEDITSQTFIEMFNNLEKIEWRGLSLKFWLFRTAKNLAYKNFEKFSKVTPTDSFEKYEEAKIESFEDVVLSKDELNLVVQEIEKLNPTERELINLRVWEEMSFEEIAELSSEKSITVRQRFYRAVEKMKVSLESKNYKRFAKMGFVLGGLASAETIQAFSATPAVAASITQSVNILLPTGIMTTGIISSAIAGVKTFATTHIITTAIVATTAVTATVGGGYVAYNNYSKGREEAKNVIQTTPTPTPTVEITQTQAPTQTPTTVVTSTPTPTPTPVDRELVKTQLASILAGNEVESFDVSPIDSNLAIASMHNTNYTSYTIVAVNLGTKSVTKLWTLNQNITGRGAYSMDNLDLKFSPEGQYFYVNKTGTNVPSLLIMKVNGQIIRKEDTAFGHPAWVSATELIMLNPTDDKSSVTLNVTNNQTRVSGLPSGLLHFSSSPDLKYLVAFKNAAKALQCESFDMYIYSNTLSGFKEVKSLANLSLVNSWANSNSLNYQKVTACKDSGLVVGPQYVPVILDQVLAL